MKIAEITERSWFEDGGFGVLPWWFGELGVN
jgi:hypothetical protein